MSFDQSKDSILASNKLSVGYKTPCTHPVTFSINKPGIYALIGPNGSGKSTFLKTLVGLIKPICGEFYIHPHRKITYVPQLHTVNPFFHLTMKDFILQGFGPSFKTVPKIIDKISSYTKNWQLENQLNKCFHELSGGQKTRTMIVRALISEPNTIFLDEPLASLDPCCQEQLMETLANLIISHKACIVLADHHLEKFNHLVNGRIVFEKKHDDALTHIISEIPT